MGNTLYINNILKQLIFISNTSPIMSITLLYTTILLARYLQGLCFKNWPHFYFWVFSEEAKMLINHLKSHIFLFLAFPKQSIWIPRVIGKISYGFLASLWIVLWGYVSIIGLIFIFGSFLRRQRCL